VRARRPSWEIAFSSLFERYRVSIYRRCVRRLDNVQDAEDASQETLLRAMHGITGFEGRSGLRTWLFAIADNECNCLVQRRQRHQYSAHLRCLIQIHEENRRAKPHLDREKVSRVGETLGKLPPAAREVLGLRFFREASFDEIARTLGISLSAAKMRLYRALDLFKATHRTLDPESLARGTR
jgi:RNA polymerase sigma-70 factor (ECF subfamily)